MGVLGFRALLLVLLPCVLQASKWVNSSIDQTLRMRSCMHDMHVVLFNDLFLFTNDVNERRLLEATGLQYLASQLRLGKSFCDGYVATVHVLVKRLKHDIFLAKRRGATDQTLLQNGWALTLKHLEEQDKYARCALRVSMIAQNDPKGETGVFSLLVRCMNAYRKESVAKLVIDVFKEEEAAVVL